MLLLLALPSGNRAANQPNLIGTVKNFRVVPEYYPAPNHAQPKSVVQGAEAKPQPGGRALITEGRLQTFQANGAPELTVQTPSCAYDNAKRALSSADVLRAETADGKFRFEGRGFLWQQTNALLIISNDVKTLLHPGALDRSKAGELPANLEAIDVASKTFQYSAETGDAVYSDSVRVTGTNLALTAGVLRLNVPVSDRRVRSIAAGQGVEASYAGFEVKGRQAEYSTDSQRLEVSGEPAWRSGLREGSAERLIVDRTNGLFQALGNARLKLPAQGLDQGFLAGAPSSTSQFVEVRSRSHELRTNHAVFKDEVVLTVLQDGQNRGSIAADQMDVYFVGTNELTRVEAAGNVVMVREETRFTAGRAVYTANTGRALLTDNPLWTHGRRAGGGWEMEFDVAANQLRVNRGAWMRLPAEELVAYDPQLGRPGGNLPKGLEKGMGDLTGLAEITADSYSFSPVKGEFAGNVRVQHPRMWWTSGDIRIDFPKQAGRADRLLARQGVVFEVTDSRGQVLRGVGDQVSYVYGTVPGATNEFMELSGLPASLSTTNSTAVNNRFVVDLVRHTITASGRYAITGTTNASSLPALPSTDQFKLPETRRKR